MCLGYAGWALTARRGIFQDLSDANTVSLDAATRSDVIDTILFVVAAIVAVIALAVWLATLRTTEPASAGLGIVGLVVSGLGVIAAVTGQVLASRIADASSQSAQGDRGVSATLVTGGGLVLLAVGLMIGAVVVRRRQDAEQLAPDDWSSRPQW